MKGTRQCWKDATPGMVVVMCVFGICGIDLRLKGGTWNLEQNGDVSGNY